MCDNAKELNNLNKKNILAATTLVLILALGLGIVTYNKTADALLFANIQALTNGEGGTSNNEGDGSKFFYEHLQGQPGKCTMYRNAHVSGSVDFSSKDMSSEFGWTSVRVTGVEDYCPNSGDGCTAYSCTATN